jgi:hypothetical protein
MVAGELHGWVCGSVIDGFLFVLLGLLVCGKLEVAVASFQFLRAGELPACGSKWKLPGSPEMVSHHIV